MGVGGATGANPGVASRVHTPLPERVADKTDTKSAKPKPAEAPIRSGASGHDTTPGAVVTETKTTAQAATARRASAASETAFQAVSAYQAERDHPATSGEEHKHLPADLKEFAVAAAKLDRQLQTMNTKACLHEETAAKAERAELKRNGASVDEIIKVEAWVSNAVRAHTESKAAQAKAEKLRNVDTAELPAVVTETKTTAQASLAHRASDASDTAFKAVSAYQAERDRDRPMTLGEEHKQLIVHLKEFAVAATKLDRQLQAMNTKACGHEESAAKAERAALKEKGAPDDELVRVEASVTSAVIAHKHSLVAQTNAEKLRDVDHVNLIDYLAPDRN
jgi:hypothetical protein